ncbi:MAG: hypothetical protein VB018_03965 [Lachnospiraceae bacterium]|nr:hypothetical protein [Lachnospiraceae bacterium]
MAKMTIAEAKKAAAEAADEAVTLGDKIRETITDETVLEIADTLENEAIEKAGEAATGEKAAEVNEAATAAMEVIERMKVILNGEIVAAGEGGKETEAEAAGGEAEQETDTQEQKAPEETEEKTEQGAEKKEIQQEEKPQEEVKQQEEVKSYIYLGPSIKKHGLRENTVFRGTKSDTLKHLEAAISETPQIEKLIFETKDAAEKKKKAREKGNSIFNAYEAVRKA